MLILFLCFIFVLVRLEISNSIFFNVIVIAFLWQSHPHRIHPNLLPVPLWGGEKKKKGWKKMGRDLTRTAVIFLTG